jgi:thiol:disulfide interchange protein
MGLPLILVTVFGNRLLPKSGPWMSHVKTAFGFVILALPVFLLERIVGDPGVYVCGQCSASPSSAGRLSPRWALPGRGCGWCKSSCLPPRWSARVLCRTGRLALRQSSSRRTWLHPRQLVAELNQALAQAKVNR